MKKISVVSPCYNEEDNVETCYETVKAIFERDLPGYEREHIFIDNCSSDRTVEILKAIAEGRGPSDAMLALGYAGWGPGQLDAEMQANAWLNVPADEELIFGDDLNEKWERCIGKLGVHLAALSGEIGHA